MGNMSHPIIALIKYKKNFWVLKDEIEKLKNAIDRVEHDVDAAKSNGEEIENDVVQWLTTVRNKINEVEKVELDEENAKKKCLLGLCPNLWTRYRLSMEAEEETKGVAELLHQGKFVRISYRAAVPHIISPASDYQAFKSRTQLLNGIIEALADASIDVVGVYGMAGVGKTTLVKEVSRQVKKSGLFDVIITTTVTRTPDVMNIQSQIAELLGLKFEEQSVVVRALRLRKRFKKERTILVVLDDIWKGLDLKEVGIPFGDEHKGCKILLTSSDLNVLSGGMNAQKNFAVGLLNEEEAWLLFAMLAGDCIESYDLKPTAIKLARKCAGLPIAIAAVAKALKGRPLFEWKNALRELERPFSSDFNWATDVYSSIELSYNQLEREQVKLTFLLCSLLGHNGLIQDLLKYTIGLDLFRGVLTIEEARNKALTVVNKLKASCLLIDSDNDEQFDIHDVFCDVALSIASRQHHMFVLRNGDVLKEWPDEEIMKNCRAIDIRFPRIICKLPDELKCSQLSFFRMACDGSMKIPANFFRRTRRLKVLELTGMHFPKLTVPLHRLKNLRTLCLHQCSLEDISIIGELENLEILSLARSDISALPREIGKLTGLMMLDLSGCTKLKTIPPNVLSFLFKLEELYMDNSFVHWQVNVHGSERRNASLEELKPLSHLTTLYAHIPNFQIIPEGLFIETLDRYRISIGGDAWDWSGEFKYSRTMKFIELYASMYWEHGEKVKQLLKETEDLYLDQLEGFKNVLVELNGGEDFPRLKKIHIQNGLGVQYIATEKFEFSQLQSMTLQDLPQLVSFSPEEETSQQKQGYTSTKPLFNKQLVFPWLEDLHLSRINIERIWPNELAATSYRTLRRLVVDGCDNLKCLISRSAAKCLVQLRHLGIINCRRMRQIVETEEELQEITSYVISFPCLNSLKMKDLPKLIGFYLGNDIIEFPSLNEVQLECCPEMEIFCNGDFGAPKLQNIQISEGEHIGRWGGDLNTTIRQFSLEKLMKNDKAKSEGELKVEVRIAGTQGEEARQWEEPQKEKKEMEAAHTQKEKDHNVLDVTENVSQSSEPDSTLTLSTPIVRAIMESVKSSAKDDIPVPDEAKAQGFSQTEEVSERFETGLPAMKNAEVIDEAKLFSGIGSKVDSPLNLKPLEVEVTRETATTPVEKPLSAAEKVPSPSLTAENMEIILDENEGTLSTHEIENEAAQKDHGILQVTENVYPSSEPASTLILSTPSDRAIMETVASIPSAKDDEEVLERYETGVAAITTLEQSVSKILECMGTDTIRRIAVHGVCGVGKSSVLRTLANNPKTKREFDLIIWVTVSKYWNPKKIQDQILQQLPPASSNAEPFQVLKGKKFLLLLDDVWEQIDLQKMDIPDPSMMIVATRDRKVCAEMEDVTVVNIKPIPKEEAWKLFHEQVGGVVDLPSIQHFAQGIVEMCCGLPLLIIVTGRALADEKNVSVWEDAFNEFSVPGRDIKSRMEDLIQLLKFSFDRLKSRSLKSCFLHCALFSEDQEIRIDKFIEYCIQEGLVDGSWSDAYERGHAIVDALLRALLLETTDNGLSIRMPDVMRDLALGILSSYTSGRQSLLTTYSKPLKPENKSSSTGITAGHRFLCRVAAGLTEPPTAEEWGKSKVMFLMDNKLSTLPEKPNCPELEILLLQRNYLLREIPDLFFDNMPSLKVLNLSKTRIKYLPKSISDLKRLEKLLLHDCERLIELPSEVGFLKLLQILDLGGTEITELPKEIAKLYYLTHLEVSLYGSSTTSEHVKLPSQFISRLKALETLRINVYPGDSWWNNSVGSIAKELSNLKKLTSLSFYFPEVKFLELFLQKNASWKKRRLTEFKLVVGRDIKFNASRVPRSVQLNYGSISGGCLRFVNSKKIPNAISEVLARCTAFYLDHHLDILSLSQFGISSINKLEYCIISECPCLETIIEGDEGTEVVFPCLEHLSIHYSWSLKCIWKGVVPEGSFAALRTLSLRACPKLTYVFKSSMLQFISNLENLQVDDCEAIKTIVSSEEATESCCIILESLTLQYLPELVYIWEGVQTKLLFKCITVYNCPRLKQICADSELKQILKEIRAEEDRRDELLGSDFEATFTSILEGDVHCY